MAPWIYESMRALVLAHTFGALSIITRQEHVKDPFCALELYFPRHPVCVCARVCVSVCARISVRLM